MNTRVYLITSGEVDSGQVVPKKRLRQALRIFLSHKRMILDLRKGVSPFSISVLIRGALDG